MISSATRKLVRSTHLHRHIKCQAKNKTILHYNLGSETFDCDVVNNSFYRFNSSRLASTYQSKLSSNGNKDPQQKNGKLNSNLDTRSEVKLSVLEETKKLTDEIKLKFTNEKEGYDEWIEHERKLSDAYSKAIKYTARLRSKDTALKSGQLLEEMISRHGFISSKSIFFSLQEDDDGGSSIIIHDDTIDQTIQSLSFDDNGNVVDTITVSDDIKQKDETLFISSESIPPPTKQDFNNLMHSWASSKAKKKGLHAETLLWRMMELAIIQPGHFEFPDSRMFALVVKCYAGSTAKLAPERIELLHKYHELLASLHGSPMEKDDPYLLMHSIKSIDDFNYGKIRLDQWLERLHSYVLDKSNVLKESERGNKIDLTGTYTSILRGFAQVGQVEKANEIFHKMQELSNNDKIGTMDGFVAPATIDLKTNSCNLLLGSCRRRAHLPIAIQLLNQMIESMKTSDSTSGALPLPNDQSFAIVISNLTQMADMNAAISIGEKFLSQFEEAVKGEKIDASVNVHNAFIELLASFYGHRTDLLSMCKDTTDRLSKMASSYPTMKPDTNTWNAHLKACATVCNDLEVQQERIAEAKQLFEKMKAGTDVELSDKSFQYMMKCVSNIEDCEQKQDEIKELFQTATQMGFVNAEVLQLLKQNVSEEEFIKIVGNGRLADNWIKNVTSVAVRYTDFTNGGANKHARRKGKSTSNWAKKQRRREEQIKARKQAKAERRLKRKNRMNKG